MRPAAWDRVEWQSTMQGELSLVSLARPILVVLQWLHAKRLLTSSGVVALEKAKQALELEALCLDRTMVLPRGAAFLDNSYHHWQERWAANMIMSESSSMADDATADLDALWSARRGRPTRS
jgi:hypothetical protein